MNDDAPELLATVAVIFLYVFGSIVALGAPWAIVALIGMGTGLWTVGIVMVLLPVIIGVGGMIATLLLSVIVIIIGVTS